MGSKYQQGVCKMGETGLERTSRNDILQLIDDLRKVHITSFA
jgi:hypothetical protein